MSAVLVPMLGSNRASPRQPQRRIRSNVLYYNYLTSNSRQIALVPSRAIILLLGTKLQPNPIRPSLYTRAVRSRPRHPDVQRMENLLGKKFARVIRTNCPPTLFS